MTVDFFASSILYCSALLGLILYRRRAELRGSGPARSGHLRLLEYVIISSALLWLLHIAVDQMSNGILYGGRRVPRPRKASIPVNVRRPGAQEEPALVVYVNNNVKRMTAEEIKNRIPKKIRVRRQSQPDKEVSLKELEGLLNDQTDERGKLRVLDEEGEWVPVSSVVRRWADLSNHVERLGLDRGRASYRVGPGGKIQFFDTKGNPIEMSNDFALDLLVFADMMKNGFEVDDGEGPKTMNLDKLFAAYYRGAVTVYHGGKKKWAPLNRKLLSQLKSEVPHVVVDGKHEVATPEIVDKIAEEMKARTRKRSLTGAQAEGRIDEEEPAVGDSEPKPIRDGQRLEPLLSPHSEDVATPLHDYRRCEPHWSPPPEDEATPLRNPFRCELPWNPPPEDEATAEKDHRRCRLYPKEPQTEGGRPALRDEATPVHDYRRCEVHWEPPREDEAAPPEDHRRIRLLTVIDYDQDCSEASTRSELGSRDPTPGKPGAPDVPRPDSVTHQLDREEPDPRDQGREEPAAQGQSEEGPGLQASGLEDGRIQELDRNETRPEPQDGKLKSLGQSKEELGTQASGRHELEPKELGQRETRSQGRGEKLGSQSRDPEKRGHRGLRQKKTGPEGQIRRSMGRAEILEAFRKSGFKLALSQPAAKKDPPKEDPPKNLTDQPTPLRDPFRCELPWKPSPQDEATPLRDPFRCELPWNPAPEDEATPLRDHRKAQLLTVFDYGQDSSEAPTRSERGSRDPAHGKPGTPDVAQTDPASHFLGQDDPESRSRGRVKPTVQGQSGEGPGLEVLSQNETRSVHKNERPETQAQRKKELGTQAPGQDEPEREGFGRSETRSQGEDKELGVQGRDPDKLGHRGLGQERLRSADPSQWRLRRSEILEAYRKSGLRPPLPPLAAKKDTPKKDTSKDLTEQPTPLRDPFRCELPWNPPPEDEATPLRDPFRCELPWNSAPEDEATPFLDHRRAQLLTVFDYGQDSSEAPTRSERGSRDPAHSKPGSPDVAQTDPASQHLGQDDPESRSQAREKPTVQGQSGEGPGLEVLSQNETRSVHKDERPETQAQRKKELGTQAPGQDEQEREGVGRSETGSQGQDKELGVQGRDPDKLGHRGLGQERLRSADPSQWRLRRSEILEAYRKSGLRPPLPQPAAKKDPPQKDTSKDLTEQPTPLRDPFRCELPWNPPPEDEATPLRDPFRCELPWNSAPEDEATPFLDHRRAQLLTVFDYGQDSSEAPTRSERGSRDPAHSKPGSPDVAQTDPASHHLGQDDPESRSQAREKPTAQGQSGEGPGLEVLSQNETRSVHEDERPETQAQRQEELGTQAPGQDEQEREGVGRSETGSQGQDKELGVQGRDPDKLGHRGLSQERLRSADPSQWRLRRSEILEAYRKSGLRPPLPQPAAKKDPPQRDTSKDLTEQPTPLHDPFRCELPWNPPPEDEATPLRDPFRCELPWNPSPEDEATPPRDPFRCELPWNPAPDNEATPLEDHRRAQLLTVIDYSQDPNEASTRSELGSQEPAQGKPGAPDTAQTDPTSHQLGEDDPKPRFRGREKPASQGQSGEEPELQSSSRDELEPQEVSQSETPSQGQNKELGARGRDPGKLGPRGSSQKKLRSGDSNRRWPRRSKFLEAYRKSGLRPALPQSAAEESSDRADYPPPPPFHDPRRCRMYPTENASKNLTDQPTPMRDAFRCELPWNPPPEDEATPLRNPFRCELPWNPPPEDEAAPEKDHRRCRLYPREQQAGSRQPPLVDEATPQHDYRRCELHWTPPPVDEATPEDDYRRCRLHWGEPAEESTFSETEKSEAESAQLIVVFGEVPAILQSAGENAKAPWKITEIWTLRGLKGYAHDQAELDKEYPKLSEPVLDEYKALLKEKAAGLRGTIDYLEKKMLRLKASERENAILEAVERIGQGILKSLAGLENYMSTMEELHKKCNFENIMGIIALKPKRSPPVKRDHLIDTIMVFHPSHPGLVCADGDILLTAVELCFNTDHEPVDCHKSRYTTCPPHIVYLPHDEEG